MRKVFPSHERRMAIHYLSIEESQLFHCPGLCPKERWYVHEFPETYNAGVSLEPPESIGFQGCTARLKSRGRHARGQKEEKIHREVLGILEHELNSGLAEDVGDLMRVSEDRRCPVSETRPSELVGDQQAAFDMDMTVHKARGEVKSTGIKDLLGPESFKSNDPSLVDRYRDIFNPPT
ncbi:MAG: hypothetical protein DRI93_05985 [Aquificota bacterium]|nr:MAG: hypothetical protein DRI93_05985 [Aquificota bacterium]